MAAKILKPFETATPEMSFQNYVSISKIIPLAKSLQQAASATPLDVRKALGAQMRQSFVNMEGNVLANAAVLNPRFKNRAFCNNGASTGEQNLAQEMASMIVVAEDVEEQSIVLIRYKVWLILYFSVLQYSNGITVLRKSAYSRQKVALK